MVPHKTLVTQTLHHRRHLRAIPHTSILLTSHTCPSQQPSHVCTQGTLSVTTLGDAVSVARTLLANVGVDFIQPVRCRLCRSGSRREAPAARSCRRRLDSGSTLPTGRRYTARQADGLTRASRASHTARVGGGGGWLATDQPRLDGTCGSEVRNAALVTVEDRGCIRYRCNSHLVQGLNNSGNRCGVQRYIHRSEMFYLLLNLCDWLFK